MPSSANPVSPTISTHSARFKQHPQKITEALEQTSVNLYFADFKSSGVVYKNTPNVVGLQTVGNSTTIEMVGEIKVPWVADHSLDAASLNKIPKLAVKLT